MKYRFIAVFTNKNNEKKLISNDKEMKISKNQIVAIQKTIQRSITIKGRSNEEHDGVIKNKTWTQKMVENRYMNYNQNIGMQKIIENRMNYTGNEHTKKTIRVLLLGTSDSGKTTIVKQLKKIHNITDDIEIIGSYIQNAVVGYVKLLCRKSKQLGDTYDEKTYVDEKNEAMRVELSNLNSPYNLNQALTTKISTIWDDEGIKETLKLRARYQIHDNVAYFLNHIDIIFKDYYQPTFDDYVRICTHTTGFEQTNIIANIDKFGSHTFEFTDVGGRRSERQKWMKLISEDVHAVLYICALSEYDLKLFEDKKTNRLVEAINLFKTIMIKGKFFYQ
eukprot:129528_1